MKRSSRTIDLKMETGKFYKGNFEIKEMENLVTKINVILSSHFLGYEYKLIFQLNDLKPVTTEKIPAIDGILSYTLTNQLTKEPGILYLQIEATKPGTVVNSDIYRLKIIKALH